MGGGTDVDEAFAWHIDNANGGDFLILRASGADGYNVNNILKDIRIFYTVDTNMTVCDMFCRIMCTICLYQLGNHYIL